MLAALAGLCGAGIMVRITPAWSEPLVLWQAALGEPSTGKSSALAPMRRLLGTIEEERRALDDGAGSVMPSGPGRPVPATLSCPRRT